jgi:hypothetical protein
VIATAGIDLPLISHPHQAALAMKKSQFAKNVGLIVQLRPIAKRPTPDGELPLGDHDWKIDSVDDPGMRLHNLATGHEILLSYDQIHSYMGNPNRDTAA